MRGLLLAALLLGAVPGLAAEDWQPVREQSLLLRPGSPLDFSAILPNGPIDEASRIVIGAGGRLSLAATPTTPARLACASLAWSPASGGFPDHGEADVYARQLAMHGYNLARFHFVDASLMDGRDADFDFDPETLDRFHYLMAALKREGIYWMIDGLSSERGGYGGFDDRWDAVGELKLDVHLEESAFAHWQQLVERLYGTVNPYTAMTPLADPALAMVVLVNENGLEFESLVHETGGPAYSPKLRAGFNAFLRARYGTDAALAKAWNGLGRDESLAGGSIRLPGDRYEAGPRMRDLALFFLRTETRTAARMIVAVRELGYAGPVTSYNNWTTVQASLSRAALPAVALNTYHDWTGSLSPGASIEQTSSLDGAAQYYRAAAAARWLGRPFVLTEFDHLFWNRYRYESGLVMPAYAALQGWDAICRHAHGPIVLRYGEPFPFKTRMLPYATALDPVARAGETLAALLFRRGDVAPARALVPLLVTGEDDVAGSSEAREPDALTRLALVTRIGLAESDGGLPAAGQPRSDADLQRLLRLVLPPGNSSDFAAGLAESDTGEILLDAAERQFRLATPRTEALAFSHLPEDVRLGAVTLQAAEGAGLFSLSALDAASLGESRRMLLIFATDARSSGMVFSGPDERTVLDFGRLPVLIRRGEVSFSLDNAGGGAWRISPVGLDGAVHAAVAKGDGPSIDVTLSNVGPQGPTTFFLIEREL